MTNASGTESFFKTIIELNIFETEATRTDPIQQRTAVISTRIYLLLFTLIITILTIYTALGYQTVMVSIQNPSHAVYLDLYKKYPSTLSCPCSQIAIPYGTFVSVSRQYHPICSSVFISKPWLDLLYTPNMSYFFQLDFRSSAHGHFQLISSLCSLMERFVNDGLSDFLSGTYLAPNALSAETLAAESQSKSNFIRSSVSSDVQRVVNLIRSTTHSNQLQVAMQTFKLNSLYIFADSSVLASIQGGIWLDDNGKYCFCGSTPTCSSPSGFFNLFAYESMGLYISPKQPIANVTGFRAGCYPLESLLQSTLECFFQQTCLATVIRFFPQQNLTDVEILQENTTRFHCNTTFDVMVRELFIEYWNTSCSFESYFTQCAPILCTYSFSTRNSFLFIITTLLGLYGGLTVALRILVPNVIGLWRNRKKTYEVPTPNIPLVERIRSLWQLLYARSRTLNFFRSRKTDADPFELQTAIISTYIFLVALIFFAIFLIVYTSLAVRTRTITVENPNQATFERLKSQYSTSLACPCTNIAIPYGSFMSLSPIYHPVCTSKFVSQSWIDFLSSLSNADQTFDVSDFHMSGNSFFSTIASLCSLARVTVSDAWYIFNQSLFVSGQALSRNEHFVRTRSTFTQFQSNTLEQFKHAIELIQLHASYSLSITQLNAYLATYQRADSLERIDFKWVPWHWNNCSCFLNDDCHEPMGFYTYPPDFPYEDMILKFYVPKLFVGCFVIKNTLFSSFQCFFNQSCLDTIENEIDSVSSTNISALNVESTRFSSDTSILAITDSLLLEYWNEVIQYDRYYSQCSPKLCRYQLTARNDALYIVTTLIALFGGLTTALSIIVPSIVQTVRDRIRSRNQTNNSNSHIPLNQRFKALWWQLRTKVFELNLFDSEATWYNAHHRRVSLMSTRIYLVALGAVLAILVVRNGSSVEIQQFIVYHPSAAQFEQLQTQPEYVATLECPCQQISIEYGLFISVTAHLHQLCSSDFVLKSSDWLNLLYYRWAAFYYPYDDFRLFAIPLFRLLASFCALANETVNDAISKFEANTLISSRAQFRAAIEVEANAFIDRLRESTSVTFGRTLDFIRSMAHGNKVVSATLSNWHFLSLNTSVSWTALWAESRLYGNCSCGVDPTCSSPAFIDQLFIPGFRVGCDPLEALLQSTLSCLYNISCVNRIVFMYSLSNTTMRPLNQTISPANDTVQSLIDRLMVDRWESNIHYDEYFMACAPQTCTYSLSERGSPMYIITTIIGLFGGVNVGLKIIIPALIKLAFYLLMRRQRRVQQVVHTIDSAE